MTTSKVTKLEIDCQNQQEYSILTPPQKILHRNALEIDLILQIILETLSLPDLKSCRLVNQQWKLLTSKVILRKDCCVIMLKHDSQKNYFRRTTQNERMYRPLQDNLKNFKLTGLNKLLSKSDLFPCTNFLIQGGDLCDPSIQKFLKLQGQNIKTLYLVGNYIYYVGDTTDKSVFCRLIQNQVPNLEALTIGHFSYTWSNQGQDELTLPSLKSFSWKGNSNHSISGLDITGTARSILRGAKNLEVINDFDFHHDLDLVIQSGRSSAIKMMEISLDFLRPLLIQLEKLLVNEVKLKKLKFKNSRCLPYLIQIFNEDCLTRENQIRLLNLLKNVFVSSCETLESLELFSFFSDLPNFEIPPLKKLRRLRPGHICCQGPHSEIIFPLGINLSNTFPNLRILDCSQIKCHDDDKINECFPPSENDSEFKLPTVQTLEFGGFCTHSWMTRLHHLCPNFNKLVIRTNHDFWFNSNEGGKLENFLSQVCEVWRHLVEIQFTVFSLSSPSHGLDSILTGISERNCKRLFQIPKDSADILDLNDLREKAGFMNLKDLKKLTVTFSRQFQDSLAKVKYPKMEEMAPLTHVTWYYALKWMPQLSVTVQYDQSNNQTSPETMLTSIRLYVETQHKKN